MVKGVMAAVFGAVLVGVVGPQHGCRDLKASLTNIVYAPKRDMRATVALVPNRNLMPLPDSTSVPVQGREFIVDRDVLAATLVNPIAATDSSIARGERQFIRRCVPCHGATLAGNGPVAAKFIPPPDLLNESSRGRRDGFIYSYIRNGGAVMPSYGAQVSAIEAWNLVNYIRHMQRTQPR
jgi:mono/diheme cytochrome c family protein